MLRRNWKLIQEWWFLSILCIYIFFFIWLHADWRQFSACSNGESTKGIIGALGKIHTWERAQTSLNQTAVHFQLCKLFLTPQLLNEVLKWHKPEQLHWSWWWHQTELCHGLWHFTCKNSAFSLWGSTAVVISTMSSIHIYVVNSFPPLFA